MITAAILLLLLTLVVKEFLLAYWGDHGRRPAWLRWYDLAMFAQLIVFIVIIALRILEVVNLS